MLINYFNYWFHRVRHRKRAPARASSRAPAVERLEERTLLSTVQAFDVTGVGTPFDVQVIDVPPAPQLLAGGPTGNGQYLRLGFGNELEPGTTNHNTITFDRTDPGAFGLVVADFDFRMTPQIERGDGFGFALLNTAHYSIDGSVTPDAGDPVFAAEEPIFTNSLGIGFDINQSVGITNYPDDIGNPNIRADFSNSISVHFNKNLVLQADATPIIDLASGRWIHVRVIVRAGDATPNVSVLLTPDGESPVTLIDRVAVPGLTPYESRAYFGARSGGAVVDSDIDNVNVQYLDAAKSVISLTTTSTTVEETDAAAVITVTRTGNLQAAASVRYATENATASAGTQYSAASGTLMFAPGQSTATIMVPLQNRTLQEGNVFFKVNLSNAAGNGVVGGPATQMIRIFDDETARVFGHWSSVTTWPTVAVHMHLLPTGDVMFWDRLSMVRVWDPVTQTTTAPASLDYNIFASGHSFLPDGRLLVTGGHGDTGGSPLADGVGLPNVSIYDPFGNVWLTQPEVEEMNLGRWRPTNTPLANGETLTLSGSYWDGTTNQDGSPRTLINLLPQVFQTPTYEWRDLTDAAAQAINEQAHGIDLNPRDFLAPDGRVFKAGPDQETWFLDTSGAGFWTQGPTRNIAGVRTNGGAVMYQPGKILVVGGGDPALSSAEIIDLNSATPMWQTVASLNFARRQHNVTMLPDGRVLVTGGSSGPGFGAGNSHDGDPVLPAEIWDPANPGSPWIVLPAMQVPRLYHSTAMLLPDGRVISSGGGHGADAASFHNDTEFYLPAYLFQGPRPRVTSAPSAVAYGQSFFVGTPDAASIDSISLIRTASVTHSFDQNQRFLNVPFTQTPGGLNVNAPASGTIAPPGYYMMFILNGSGVPSVARFVQIGNAGVSVIESGGTTELLEGGASETIGVALTTPPILDVTVTLDVSRLPAGLIAAPTTLTFTAANWNVPQDVTITTTATLDSMVQGKRIGAIHYATTSANPAYDNLLVAGTPVSITDTDDFNRESHTDLGAHWTERTGNTSVLSQSLAGNASGVNLITLNSAALAGAVVQADVTLPTVGASAGLVTRYAGPGETNFYLGLLTRTATGFESYIYRNVAGQYTLLAQQTLSGFSGAGGLRFEVVGSYLKLFVNNTLRLIATDARITAPGEVGIRIRSNGRVDNFSVASIEQQNPTLPFGDMFNKPDHSSLDGSWTERQGAFVIQDGAAAPTNVVANNLATVNTPAIGDVAVEAEIALDADGASAGLVARYAGPGDSNLYLGTLTKTASGYQALIYRNVGGQYVQLASQPLTGFSGTGVVRFEVVGTSLKLFVDGVLRAVANDSVLTAPGLVGMRARGGSSIDDFNAEAITVESVGLSYTDPFAKPNGAALDRVWTERLGAYSIQNETAIATNLVANSLATLNTVAVADVAVKADVNILTVGSSAGLVARYAGPGEANFYMGLMTRTTAGHQVHIYRNVAGQYTSLAMQSLQGFSGVGALRFEVVGASLKLFVNNILRAVAHDSRITAAGLAGMRSRAGASLDNVNVAGILVENASPPFTDEFAKPNDSSLNRVWTERLGAFTIQNEAAVATNLVANNLATLNTAALANAIVQADITLATNGASAGLVARYSGPGEANFYLGTVTRTASGFEAHLYRNLAGQYALLATKKLIGFSGTGELRFEVVGTSLKLFVDNHLQVEASDSMITAAGLVGMRGRTGAAFDNFHV